MGVSSVELSEVSVELTFLRLELKNMYKKVYLITSTVLVFIHRRTDFHHESKQRH